MPETKRMTAEDTANFIYHEALNENKSLCGVIEDCIRQDRKSTLEAAAERLRKYLAHTNEVNDEHAIALILHDEED
jgi:hypothetical protein